MFLTVMQTVSLVLAFAATCLAKPVALTSRDAISPPITNPTANTVWKAGETHVVTWDLSSLNGAQPSNPLAEIILGTLVDGQENLMLASPLASKFPILNGSVSLIVPSVPTGSNYIVCLFGDSGDISPAFTIIGTDASASSSPSASPTTELNAASSSNTLPPHQTTGPSTSVSLPPGVAKTGSAATSDTTSASVSVPLSSSGSVSLPGVLPSGVSGTSAGASLPSTSLSSTSATATSPSTTSSATAAASSGNSGARAMAVTHVHLWSAVSGALALWASL